MSKFSDTIFSLYTFSKIFGVTMADRLSLRERKLIKKALKAQKDRIETHYNFIIEQKDDVIKSSKKTVSTLIDILKKSDKDLLDELKKYRNTLNQGIASIEIERKEIMDQQKTLIENKEKLLHAATIYENAANVTLSMRASIASAHLELQNFKVNLNRRK